jgi:hypothetical protein
MPTFIGTSYRRGAAYDDASNRLFGAMVAGGGQINDSRRKIIDLTIRRLKDQGIWDKLDCLYMFAALDTVSALINWKTPGTFNGTNVSGTAFTADRGYTGDASADHIDTGFNPSTAGGKWTLDDACLFAWNLTADPNGGGVAGQIGTFGSQLFPDLADGEANYRGVLNSGSTNDVALVGTAREGLYAISRTSSTTQPIYRNGALGAAGSPHASTSIGNGNVAFLRSSTSFFNGQCAGGGCGSSLSAAENAALYAILLPYMQAVGAA